MSLGPEPEKGPDVTQVIMFLLVFIVPKKKIIITNIGNKGILAAIVKLYLFDQ